MMKKDKFVNLNIITDTKPDFIHVKHICTNVKHDFINAQYHY